MAISGLPAGTRAAVSVTGPDRFTRKLTGSQTLGPLTPGAYTVAAALVSDGSAGYTPTPDAQTVNVPAGTTPAAAEIAYMPAIGRLTVTVSGTPNDALADIDVSGPGFQQHLTRSTTLTDLAPGEYTVTSASITTDGALYNPSPRIQVVAVGAVPVVATVGYAAATAGVFNLSIDGMYVVQSTQTYAGTIPLVAHRDAVLRVFVLANQPNAVQAVVRVRSYLDGTLVSTAMVTASRTSVPTSVDEGDLGASWNLVIPASQVRAGLGIVADIDPDGTVTEGNEDDNVFPASGAPLPLTVRAVPTLRVRFVPIYQSANDHLGQVTADNRDQFLAATLRVHPIVDAVSDVRAVYTTSAAPVDREDDAAWGQVLSEVNALRLVDPDAAGLHYYGVVSTSYTSGIAGLGYIAGRSAMGWDYLPSGANVAAHELGHNWGRYHAPCGDVPRPDTQYPYAGGTIGVYGFDFGTGTVKPPSYTDLMGYCGTQWISDYTYLGVMDFRDTDPALTAVAAAGDVPVPGVLVWGRIIDDEPVLEPALRVVARPSLPERPGPYSIEGRAADGSAVFGLSFAPEEVADARHHGQHFAFVIPLSDARAAQLTSFRISGRNRTAVMMAAAPRGARFRVGAAPGEAALRRGANGRIALHWNAAEHPLIMVRDPSNGRVLSFARGGDAQIMADRDELELVASDRIHSERVRAKVAP